jgi:hypothetical protein
MALILQPRRGTCQIDVRDIGGEVSVPVSEYRHQPDSPDASVDVTGAPPAVATGSCTSLASKGLSGFKPLGLCWRRSLVLSVLQLPLHPEEVEQR